MGTTVRQNIVTNGLVLYLDAGNRMSYPGSGTTWRDLSGNGNNGTLTNGPTFNSSNQGSIAFDGTNDYCSFGISKVSSSLDYSYGLWFRTTTTSDGIMFGADGCGDNGGHYSFIGATGAVGIRVIGGSSVIIATSGTAYNDNKWHSAFFTKTTTQLSIYVDGQLRTIGNTPSSIGSTLYNMYIGIRQGTLSNPINCGTNYYSGSIATLLLYNRALTPQEILQNYNATKTRFGLT